MTKSKSAKLKALKPKTEDGAKTTIVRKTNGHFVTSGNPGGKQKIPEWFKAKGERALELMVNSMEDDDLADVLRQDARKWVAERVFGKAKQDNEGEGIATGNELLARLLSTPLTVSASISSPTNTVSITSEPADTLEAHVIDAVEKDDDE